MNIELRPVHLQIQAVTDFRVIIVDERLLPVPSGVYLVYGHEIHIDTDSCVSFTDARLINPNFDDWYLDKEIQEHKRKLFTLATKHSNMKKAFQHLITVIGMSVILPVLVFGIPSFPFSVELKHLVTAAIGFTLIFTYFAVDEYAPKHVKKLQFPVYFISRLFRAPFFWVEIPKFKKWNNFKTDLLLIVWFVTIYHSWHFIYVGLVVLFIRAAVKMQKPDPVV